MVLSCNADLLNPSCAPDISVHLSCSSLARGHPGRRWREVLHPSTSSRHSDTNCPIWPKAEGKRATGKRLPCLPHYAVARDLQREIVLPSRPYLRLSDPQLRVRRLHLLLLLLVLLAVCHRPTQSEWSSGDTIIIHRYTASSSGPFRVKWAPYLPTTGSLSCSGINLTSLPPFTGGSIFLDS